MSLPFYIARRYTISRSKSTAVNIITGIAALGIVASTAALFIILSAFSGLREYTVSFTNAMDPDLQVAPQKGKSFIVTPQQEQQLKETEGIAVFSKIAEERVLFYFDEKEHVAFLKGTDSLFTKVNPMEKHLVAGKWIEQQTLQVVIGYDIANKLSLGMFEFNRPFQVYVPKAGKGAIDTPEEAFNKSNLSTIGIYSINDEVNGKYVFCSLGLAQSLLQFSPDQVTSLEIKLIPGTDEEIIREKINTIFNDSVTIKNRAQLNDSLYKMLNAENLVTYLFCSLVVVLTLFCLAGALIMLILDKRENIKTLFSLGAEVTSLRSIFLYQGIFITILGALLGLFIGAAVVLIQEYYQPLMLTESLAYPVDFSIKNIFIVLLTIFVLGFLASWIAAGRVNKSLLEN